MDALTLLNEHVDVEELLEHYDFDVRTDGVMLRSACKIHDGDNPNAFVINAETGLWYCHTNCGGGDIYTLVQHMEECDFVTSVKIVANLFGVDIQNLEIKERKSSYVKEIKKWSDIMARWTSKKEVTNEYELPVEVKKVKKFRDFRPDTLDHFGLGFVKEIEQQKNDGTFYTLRDRLVIPIIQNNKQIGVSLRKTKAKDYPKWSHQPKGIETRKLLYNYDATRGAKSIVIVEGAFDVWAFHEIGVTAVATYGAHITDEQYKLLIKTGADLVFAFDGDEAGRDALNKAVFGYKDKQGKFHDGIFKYKANIECIFFDEGEDPASITRKQLKQKYESREKIC